MCHLSHVTYQQIFMLQPIHNHSKKQYSLCLLSSGKYSENLLSERINHNLYVTVCTFMYVYMHC